MQKGTQQEVSQLSRQRNNKSRNVLVVGANSQIGSALIVNLRKESYNVFGTTRDIKNNNRDLLYFDLFESNLSIDFTKYECVIICAAITNIAQCESEPEKCERINSTNTIALIDKCVISKCFVIFLSSSAVFDGKKPFYKYTDKASPITNYGNFKLIVEKYIQALPPNKACVLRLTKVVTENTPFIQNWKTAAEKGGEVKAFRNRLISPIAIEDVVDSLQLLVERKNSGIFQLGGSEEISFYEYAKKVFSSNPNILGNIVATDATEPIVADHSSLTTFLPYAKNSYSFEGCD